MEAMMRNFINNSKGLLRGVAALAGWLSLIVMLSVFLSGKEGLDIFGGLVNYLSYFTILSNILGSLAMTFPLLAPQSTPGQFFSLPVVRMSVSGYLLITFSIYALLLSGAWQPAGIVGLADIVLHYVFPLYFLFDFLLFTKRRSLTLKHTAFSLLFPLVYAGYTLLRGALTSFYPYYFIDVGQFGWYRIGINIIFLSITFLAFALVLFILNRYFGLQREA
jgi:hypothetical protein